MITAKRRASATIAFFMPRRLAICIAQALTLFLVNDDRLDHVPDTSYLDEGILERRHLQALLKQSLLKGDDSPLGDDLKLICEEFGDWEESNRRIDLLCIDKEARIVVVELKRTEDGGHMELQAIRYAAMISSMTLEQAITAHARFLGGDEAQTRARADILTFLDFESTDDVELAGNARIPSSIKLLDGSTCITEQPNPRPASRSTSLGQASRPITRSLRRSTTSAQPARHREQAGKI